jgi:sec-independent protein translocase protein TatB
MLDFSFSELILIAVVGLLVIKPQDIPVVMRHVMSFWREVRSLYLGLKRQVEEVMDEAGVNDLRQNMTTIIDLEGKPQKAYDVSELKSLEAPKPAASLPPIKQEGEGI